MDRQRALRLIANWKVPSKAQAITERQAAILDAQLEIAQEYGWWDRGIGPDGAHYILAADNVFKTDGVMCQNCLFYVDATTCRIVQPPIQPQGVCKLWVIPADKLAAIPDNEGETPLDELGNPTPY